MSEPREARGQSPLGTAPSGNLATAPSENPATPPSEKQSQSTNQKNEGVSELRERGAKPFGHSAERKHRNLPGQDSNLRQGG